MINPNINYSLGKSRKILLIFIVVTYLALGLYPFLLPPSSFSQIISTIDRSEEETQFEEILKFIESQNFVGRWMSKTNTKQTVSECKMAINSIFKNKQILHVLEIQLKNGLYIDEGQILVKTLLNSSDWMIKKGENYIQVFTESVIASYLVQRYINKITKVSETKNYVKMKFKKEQKEQNLTFFVSYSEGFQQDLILTLKQEQLADKIPQIIFGFFLLIIGVSSVLGVVKTIEQINRNKKSAQNYSFTLMIVFFFWDINLCILAYQFCVKPNSSFIFFMVPAFIFCLLAGVMDLFVLQNIYEQKFSISNYWIKGIGFYLIIGVVFLLRYPILIIINLNLFFLLLLPLAFIAQLYNNAYIGYQPNLFHPFYSCYIFPRYLVLLYFKCFPWNALEYEPNYLFGIICITIILTEIILMRVQQQFGSRAIFPNFILPPTLQYVRKSNLLQKLKNDDCTICLIPLQQKSAEANLKQSQQQSEIKVLKTPCGHQYHEQCLKVWVKVKKQCPQCRKRLPPFP